MAEYLNWFRTNMEYHHIRTKFQTVVRDAPSFASAGENMGLQIIVKQLYIFLASQQKVIAERGKKLVT